MAIQSAKRAGAAVLTAQVAELQAQLQRAGIHLRDMRSSPALELQFVGVPELGMPSPEPRGHRIERVEHDPIIARAVPPRRTPSRLRYFLDGSQRTLAVWRIGLIPVVTTIAAAGLLRRSDSGDVEMAPGTLRFRHAWIIPRRTGIAEVDSIIAQIEESGGHIRDPLPARLPEHDYQTLVGDYGKLVQASYVAARSVREELELQLLNEWQRALPSRDEHDWLVVDGRLRLRTANAIGLVKSMARQQLDGMDAITVLNLPPGQRTTAFRLPEDFQRDPELHHDLPEQEAFAASGQSDAPMLWYLRMHDSLGLDARHALVRLETSPDVRSTEQIDELSAWLLAERAPRATSDVRWATLLYPIHLLEEILKRRVEAFTRGWPGTR